MNLIRLVVLLAISLFAPLLMAQNEKPVLLCGEHGNCADIPILSEKALAGSPEAAFELQSYYLDEDNLEEAIYWAQVSVENGSKQGRYAYAFLLNLRGHPRDLERAKFHLKRAIQEGHPLAQSLLREIELKQKLGSK